MAIAVPTGLGSASSSAHGTPAITFNTGAAVTAGGIVFVVVSYFKNGGTKTPSGITINGNAMTQDRRNTNGNDLLDVWFYRSAAGLSSGVACTATWADTVGMGGRLIAACFTTGVITTGSSEAGNTATGTGTGWASGNATNVTSEAIYIGGTGTETATNPTTSTATAGTELYDLYLAADQQGMVVHYRIETTIASRNLAGTLSATSTANTGAVAVYGADTPAAATAKQLAALGVGT